MKDHLRQEDLLPSDKAWLVVDKDQWTDEQLNQLHSWSLDKDNYGFALSNPKFEYWLLLPFLGCKPRGGQAGGLALRGFSLVPWLST